MGVGPISCMATASGETNAIYLGNADFTVSLQMGVKRSLGNREDSSTGKEDSSEFMGLMSQFRQGIPTCPHSNFQDPILSLSWPQSATDTLEGGSSNCI